MLMIMMMMMMMIMMMMMPMTMMMTTKYDDDDNDDDDIIGYYHQNSELSNTDGSGVAGRIAYNLSNGVTLGFNISYDQLFETRVSGDIKLRFGSNGYGAPSKRSQQPALQPTIQALSGTPTKRNIRVIAQN
jgi:hypothetical protein